jgi:hypothetical protein
LVPESAERTSPVEVAVEYLPDGVAAGVATPDPSTDQLGMSAKRL